MGRRKSSSNKKMRKAASVIGAAVFLIFVVLYVLDVFFSNSSESLSAECEFHFIDVGQGDCTMVTTGEYTVVIDAGPNSAAQNTASYIRSYTDEIDYLILTHPHEDHVGGASEIIDDIKTDNVIMTDAFSDTYTFSKLISTLEESGVTVTQAEAGNSFTAGDLQIQLLAPLQDFDDYNDYSIVAKIAYKDTSAMITGDAETKSEKTMLGFYNGKELSADILKLAHHGSSTSSSLDFLKAVSPEYAVISCGKDNSYGHPHQSTLKKLDSLDIPYVRTDSDGTAVFASNGSTVWLEED